MLLNRKKNNIFLYLIKPGAERILRFSSQFSRRQFSELEEVELLKRKVVFTKVVFKSFSKVSRTIKKSAG